MGLLGDVHGLADGLKIVTKLEQSTVKLTESCQSLEDSVVKLTQVLQKLNKTLESIKKESNGV